MSAPVGPTTRSSSTKGLVRRVAAAIILSGFVFLSLWLLALDLITSLLIASCFCTAVVLTSAISDLIGAVVDVIATAVFGVLAAIAALVAGIFSLFG
jgi:hypothetical protein